MKRRQVKKKRQKNTSTEQGLIEMSRFIEHINDLLDRPTDSVPLNILKFLEPTKTNNPTRAELVPVQIHPKEEK